MLRKFVSTFMIQYYMYKLSQARNAIRVSLLTDLMQDIITCLYSEVLIIIGVNDGIMVITHLQCRCCLQTGYR